MSIDSLLGAKGSSGPHNTKLNLLYINGESSLQVCSDGFMSVASYPTLRTADPLKEEMISPSQSLQPHLTENTLEKSWGP